jgi:hypothetical protein
MARRIIGPAATPEALHAMIEPAIHSTAGQSCRRLAVRDRVHVRTRS